VIAMSAVAEPAPERRPVVVAGSSHDRLARAIADVALLGARFVPCPTRLFPDGDRRVAVDCDVANVPAVVVQTMAAPVGEHLLEMLLIADALWRRGARPMGAIVPYLAYARQERRTTSAEPLGARVVAEIIDRGRFEFLIFVDLHSASIEGFFSTRVYHLSAAPVLVRAIASGGIAAGEVVVVAPDQGAVKLARLYAQSLGCTMALVHKERSRDGVVSSHEVVGDVRDKRVVFVDDMISTGETLAAAARTVVAHGASAARMTAVATHGLFVANAVDTLRRAGITDLVSSDSLPSISGSGLSHTVVSIDHVIAECIVSALR